MPLFLKQERGEFEKVCAFYGEFSADSSIELDESPVIVKESDNVLYVNQGEIAYNVPAAAFTVVGTDDATTCVILLAHNPRAETLLVSHLDEAERCHGLSRLFDDFGGRGNIHSVDEEEAWVDVYIIGGMILDSVDRASAEDEDGVVSGNGGGGGGGGVEQASVQIVNAIFSELKATSVCCRLHLGPILERNTKRDDASAGAAGMSNSDNSININNNINNRISSIHARSRPRVCGAGFFITRHSHSPSPSSSSQPQKSQSQLQPQVQEQQSPTDKNNKNSKAVQAQSLHVRVAHLHFPSPAARGPCYSLRHAVSCLARDRRLLVLTNGTTTANASASASASTSTSTSARASASASTSTRASASASTSARGVPIVTESSRVFRTAILNENNNDAEPEPEPESESKAESRLLVYVQPLAPTEAASLVPIALQLVSLSDEQLLLATSTSPYCEPLNFASDFRAALRLVLQIQMGISVSGARGGRGSYNYPDQTQETDTDNMKGDAGVYVSCGGWRWEQLQSR